MPSGFTQSFPASILFDVGVLRKHNTKFGVTDGGLTFNPEGEIRHIEFDGMRAEIEGCHRYVSQGGTIEGEFLFVGESMLEDLLPGCAVRTTNLPSNISKRITPKMSSTLFASSDYMSDLRLTAQRGDEWFEVFFDLAYCPQWNWLAGPDKDEQKVRATFRAVLRKSVAAVSTDTPPVVFNVLTGLHS